jgi:hypothetical protein
VPIAKQIDYRGGTPGVTPKHQIELATALGEDAPDMSEGSRRE